MKPEYWSLSSQSIFPVIVMLPSFKNAILFLEEIEEECYRFDRMLCQLRPKQEVG